MIEHDAGHGGDGGGIGEPSGAGAERPASARRRRPRRRLLALIAGAAVLAAVSVPLRVLADPDIEDSRASVRPHAGGCPSPAAAAFARRELRSAELRWSVESEGSAVHRDLLQIAHDARLTGALGRGDMAAALAAANGELVRHVVQIRILRGGSVLLDANPTSFDVAGAALALHGAGGRGLGRLQITVQDIIGFIKLERKIDHAGIVVLGSAGRMRTSLPAAVGVSLPRAGCVEIGARRFVVGSFLRRSYTGEPLTIWVLSRS